MSAPLRTVAELLQLWDDGHYGRGEMVGQLALIGLTHGIDATLAQLPEPWRVQVTAEIFASYDNDLPAEDFVRIGAADPDPDRELIREQLAVARRWIAAQRR